MECGTSRIEITPPFPTALFGYPNVARIYEPHKDRMLDPLQARAVYIDDGGEHGVLLISLDLCILMDKDSIAFRQALAEETGLPTQNILIACTHTHSAPLARLVPSTDGTDSAEAFISDPENTSLRYGQWLLARIAKISRLALSRKAPVSVSFQQTFTGLGYDRRCRTAEGIRHCWNLQEFPDRVPETAKEARHCVLKLDWLNKQGGVLLQSVGIHPVVMGKDSQRISADWPGHARRHMEKRMRGYQSVFFEGAAAQVQPWISTQEDPKALRLVGEAIGSEGLLLALNCRQINMEDGGLSLAVVEIPGSSIAMTVLEIGPLVLLNLPMELSVTLASRISSLLARPVFFNCLCNGWDGYWMSREEFAEGGYEVEVAVSRGVTAANSEALIEALKPYAR